MSALRYTERKIDHFKSVRFPLRLPDKGNSIFTFPNAFLNGGCKRITNAFIDATVRITTIIPTTLYDLSVGISHKNREQLTDSAITTPRTIVYLAKDAKMAAGGLALTAGGTLGYAVFVVPVVIYESMKVILLPITIPLNRAVDSAHELGPVIMR